MSKESDKKSGATSARIWFSKEHTSKSHPEP